MISYASIPGRVARQLHLSERDVAEFSETIRRRCWMVRWAPVLFGVATMFAWMLILGGVVRLLEGTKVDVLAALRRWGGIGVALRFLLSWGVGLPLAMHAGLRCCEHLIVRRLRGLPRDDHGNLCVCDECFYPMEHAAAGEISRCPECGAEYFKKGPAGD